MKGMNNLNTNKNTNIIDIKNLSKIPIDFKLFWSFIEEKYYQPAETLFPASILNKIYYLSNEEEDITDNKTEKTNKDCDSSSKDLNYNNYYKNEYNNIYNKFNQNNNYVYNTKNNLINNAFGMHAVSSSIIALKNLSLNFFDKNISNIETCSNSINNKFIDFKNSCFPNLQNNKDTNNLKSLKRFCDISKENFINKRRFSIHSEDIFNCIDIKNNNNSQIEDTKFISKNLDIDISELKNKKIDDEIEIINNFLKNNRSKLLIERLKEQIKAEQNKIKEIYYRIDPNCNIDNKITNKKNTLQVKAKSKKDNMLKNNDNTTSKNNETEIINSNIVNNNKFKEFNSSDIELNTNDINNKFLQSFSYFNALSIVNLQKQIKSLQITQFSESIFNVYKSSSLKQYFYIKLDKTEKYPDLQLNEESFRRLISYRDSSNFILSYDKPLSSKVNIITTTISNDNKIKEARKDRKGKHNNKLKSLKFKTKDNSKTKVNSASKTKKSLLLKNNVIIAQSTNIETDICHNCKLRKPLELMTKCRNKYVDRPFKMFAIHNMLLLNSDIKDLQSQISNKTLQEDHCNKYFCHFCLKGSYQTNPELNNTIHPLNNEEVIKNKKDKNNSKVKNNKIKIKGKDKEKNKLNNKIKYNKYSSKIKDKNKNKNKETDKNKIKHNNNSNNKNSNNQFKLNSNISSCIANKANINTNIKFQPIKKDWCCPWCLNDCFCSRCVRDEHIFKLIGLYVYHTGSLPNLKGYLIDNDAILNCLQENLIAFRTIVKDGLYLERVNKLNSKYRNKPEFQKSENNINSQENNYIDMYDSISYVKSKEIQMLNKYNENFIDVYDLQFKVDDLMNNTIIKKPIYDNPIILLENSVNAVESKRKGILIKTKVPYKNKVLVQNIKKSRGRPRKIKLPVDNDNNISEKTKDNSLTKKVTFVIEDNKTKNNTIKNSSIYNTQNKITTNSIINDNSKNLRNNIKKSLRSSNKKYSNNLINKRNKILINKKRNKKDFKKKLINQDKKYKNKNNINNLEVIDLTKHDSNELATDYTNKNIYCSKDLCDDIFDKKHLCKYNKSNNHIINKDNKLLINQLQNYSGTEILVYPLEDPDSYENTANTICKLKNNLTCKCSKYIKSENIIDNSISKNNYNNKNINNLNIDNCYNINEKEKDESDSSILNLINETNAKQSLEKIYIARINNKPNKAFKSSLNNFNNEFDLENSKKECNLKISNKAIKINNNKIFINNDSNNSLNYCGNDDYQNSFVKQESSISKSIKNNLYNKNTLKNKQNEELSNNYIKSNNNIINKVPFKLLVKKRLKSKADSINENKF